MHLMHELMENELMHQLMFFDTLGICREKLIFCDQLRNFSFLENVFEINFIIYPLKMFFRNPENDIAGSLKNSCSENCNQNHSKILVEKLIFY